MACLNLAFLLRFFLHFCWQPQNRGPVRTDPLIGGVTYLHDAVGHRPDRTAGSSFGSVNRPGWLGSVYGIITLSGRRPRAGLSAGVAGESWRRRRELAESDSARALLVLAEVSVQTAIPDAGHGSDLLFHFTIFFNKKMAWQRI